MKKFTLDLGHLSALRRRRGIRRLAIAALSAGFFFPNGSATMQSSSPDAQQNAAPLANTLLISEFRLRGSAGTTDEFIELYNNSSSGHTVAAASGTGYGVAASDGSLRCSVPNGTFFPARSHFLCVNTGGYSLTNYPAGNGTTATGDATYTTGIPDNIGIAVFNNNSGGASWNLANRFDAIGSTSEANTLYREGAGYPPLSATSVEQTVYRALDPITGLPVDTDNNATDLVFATTTGQQLGAGQRLGAAGPQNLGSPIFAGNSFSANLLDTSKALSMLPNRVRDTTSDPGNNSQHGTVSIRRRFRNETGANISRLRFRIEDISTFPAPLGTADLRFRSSTLVVVAAINDAATCAATGSPSTPPCTVSVQGTTIETPPAQALSGGFNTSISAGTVTLGTPLANNASINLQFLFGVQAQGAYHIEFQLEALPISGTRFRVSGNTLSPTATSDTLNRVADYDGDGKTDLSVFRPSTGVWTLRRSTAGETGLAWGISTDKITPADFDGDAKTDVAVYRPSEGRWYIFNSATSSFTSIIWGASTDIPAPGDYDGDGRADASIFRPSDGNWWLNRTTAGSLTTQFGQNGDVPTVGDYDRDGKSDIGIFRPSNGLWFIRRSLVGDLGFQFGLGTDKVAQADYDGDGRTDIAVYRPSTGQWFIANSGTPTFQTIVFGAPTDIPVPGDYDGDGRADIAIFRPSDGNWWLSRTTAGQTTIQFGQNGDRPTPNAFGN